MRDIAEAAVPLPRDRAAVPTLSFGHAGAIDCAAAGNATLKSTLTA